MAAATRKRDARKSLSQPGVDHPGRRFRGAPVRGAGHVDVSGARITMDDPNVLSGRLRLAFARDARTGRNCAVVWRRGKSLGVKFVR
jgi:hypothetical protein